MSEARGAAGTREVPTTTAGAAVPFDEAIMKATHNAFEREEPLFDQLVYHRIRSVEIDVHVTRAGTLAPRTDWFVYHADVPMFRDASCRMLSDCLGQLAAFHAAVPEHEVVTLFVDLKDRFNSSHLPSDLDEALAAALGRDAIVTPKDLLERCPSAQTIRGAVTGTCRFPTLAELRGKFIVAVTGGSLCDRSSPDSQYGRAGAAERVAFLAPDLDDTCPMERYDERPEVVFLNMSFGERRHAAEVRRRGLVGRLYKGGVTGGLDAPDEFAAANAAGGQLLATDRVNEAADPWSTTSTSHGFPFRCTGCDGTLEPSDLLGARATSGDLGGGADSFFFAYERDIAPATFSAFVSVPSSHVTRLAKGCLVARASESPDAPSVALCRPFDRDPPRLLVRREAGGATTSSQLAEIDGLSPETPAFLRLTLTPSGTSTEVLGEASADGQRWATVARAAVPALLPLRGVAVASSGPSPVKGLFGNLTRTRRGARSVLGASALALRAAIGAGVSGELFEGVVP